MLEASEASRAIPAGRGGPPGRVALALREAQCRWEVLNEEGTRLIAVFQGSSRETAGRSRGPEGWSWKEVVVVGLGAVRGEPQARGTLTRHQ